MGNVGKLSIFLYSPFSIWPRQEQTHIENTRLACIFYLGHQKNKRQAHTFFTTNKYLCMHIAVYLTE